MNQVKLLKKRLPALPYFIGNQVAKYPYRWRPAIGRIYAQRQQELALFTKFSSEQKREFVFERVKEITVHAFESVPFYNQYYQEHGFHPSALSDFDSISQIPIVSKKDLIAFDIENRSSKDSGNRILANTGGSTGSPLNFYIQTDSYGHEKSHMNHVWRKLGYSQSDSILTFSGRSKSKFPVQYDGLRHAFLVDIYQPFPVVAQAIERLFKTKKMPRFLHGYPSAIHDFLAQTEKEMPHLAEQLNDHVAGTFFGSEFPNPQWRKQIESITGAPTVSWYGHTERCVLAYEAKEPFAYYPMQTYGFTESIASSTSEQLVGTNYYNFASPFIRYNTEDGIQVEKQTEGILESFKIVDGRVGEYVLDQNNKKISLTGLIYGRHHRLFDYCRSVQLSQIKPGHAKVFYCLLPNAEIGYDPAELFDSANVDIEFTFQACDEPIRTAAGKIGLLIKPAGPVNGERC